MIFGFGKIETDMAIEIIEACAKEPHRIKEIEKELKAKAEEYDEMPRSEAPERYLTFLCHSVEDHLGSTHWFTFFHIDRRHPFSPDGWALLKAKWILHIDRDGDKTIYKEA